MKFQLTFLIKVSMNRKANDQSKTVRDERTFPFTECVFWLRWKKGVGMVTALLGS